METKLAPNATIYRCVLCGEAMVVPQGSRIKYCPACRHLREVEGGKNRWRKWSKGSGDFTSSYSG